MSSPSDSAEAEEIDEDEDGEGSGTDAQARLIKTGPLQRDLTVDQPVTSGNDSPGEPN